MNLETFINSIILGIVEGLTEFIPVSSTGHLILLIDIMNFQGPPGKVFEIVIQLGAIFAVCFLYRKKLTDVVLHLPSEREAQLFTRNILIAFMPAVVIGLLAHDFIKEVLFSPLVVSISLIVGGIFIILIEKRNIVPKHHEIEKFSLRLALYIGMCQALAMIPGVSRSGATIMGALLLKVDRKVATEFSFFLAIPTMLGATTYDVYKNFQYMNMDNIAIIAVGFLAAFASAMLIVSRVINFIKTHGFTPFGWYRIVLGSLMLAFLTL